MTPTPKDTPPADYDARANPDARANATSWGDRKHDPSMPDDVSDTADPNDPMTLRPGGSSPERAAASASKAAAAKAADEAAQAKAVKAAEKATAEKARIKAIEDARTAAAAAKGQ